MVRIVFFSAVAIMLVGCYDTAYQPHYIISKEETETPFIEPEEETVL